MYNIIEHYINRKRKYREVLNIPNFRAEFEEIFGEELYKYVTEEELQEGLIKDEVFKLNMEKSLLESFIKNIDEMLYYTKFNKAIPIQELSTLPTPPGVLKNLSHMYKSTDKTIPEDKYVTNIIEYYMINNKITHKAAVLIFVEQQNLILLFNDLVHYGYIPTNYEECFMDFAVKNLIIYSCDPLPKNQIIAANLLTYMFISIVKTFATILHSCVLFEKGIDTTNDKNSLKELEKLCTIDGAVMEHIKYFLDADINNPAGCYKQAFNVIYTISQQNYIKQGGIIEKPLQITESILEKKKYYEKFRQEIIKEFSLGNNVTVLELDNYFVRANKTWSFITGLISLKNKYIEKLQLLKKYE